jgi:hypothetical protein
MFNALEKDNAYKYLTLMGVLYVIFLLLTMIIENRVIAFAGLKILSGTLVLPFAYAISDITAEVYGYRQMRRLIWISILALYISAGMIYIIMALPTDLANKNNIAYGAVFSALPKDVFTYSIAALISIFLNAYILTKWKVFTRGKFFWLRSLGATAIGEAIFIFTWGILGFSNKFPINILLELMAMSYIYKLIFNLFLIIPSTVAVAFLKKSENIDIYDYNTKFNPFSWEA